MNFVGVLVTALLTAPCCAQFSISSFTTPVTSDYVTTAITAATPAPCTAPLSDTLVASAGTGSPCMARPDATRATQVIPKVVSTASDGSFTGAWSWTAAPTAVFAEANTIADPYNCQVATWTTTTFNGKCWKLTAATLPALAASLPGYVVNTYSPATAGISVSVVGRQ